MLGPVAKQQSPYRHNLKELARIAQYEPIASIPQPSIGFNYTLVRNRQSDYYEVPKVMRKSPPQRVKLATILQTQGKSPLFPKISKERKDAEQLAESSSRKRLKGLRSHFKRQNETTVASRERSLTIDTRLDSSEGDRLNSSQCLEGKRCQKKPISLGARTAERERLNSNSSDLSLLYSRHKQQQPQITTFNRNQSLISHSILNQEDESQEEEEYQKDAVPGPGAYSYSYSDFDKANQTKSTNISFLSKLTRFVNKEKEQIPQRKESLRYEEKEAAREKRLKEAVFKKKQIPFNSLSPRKFQCDQLSKKQVPGPEDYYPRQGLQEDLIRSIQKHFKGSFGSQQSRFKYPNPQRPNLGPGSYSSCEFEDSLQNENYYFKSNKGRFE